MPPKPPRPPPPTHFLCIPLTSHATTTTTPPSSSSTAPVSARAQLAASLAAFRADVCAPPALGGFDVPQDAVRPVGTLHLTLGVMGFGEGPARATAAEASGGGGRAEGRRGGEGEESLHPGRGQPAGEESGRERLERAKELLRGLSLAGIWRSVVANGSSNATSPLNSKARSQPANRPTTATKTTAADDRPRITLRGLASMQPAGRAAVLYAPPADPTGTLQAFCEKLRGAFVEAGLMMDEGRPLLLHATLVNTIYVRGGQRGGGGRGGGGGGGRGRGGRGGWGGGRKGERLVLDARDILDRYEDHVWLEDAVVEKVAICKMGAKKVVVDGEEDAEYEVEEEVGF
ncbi:hypothetical protein VTJ83DRAFT_6796 [Remersonia thermophila]|uniref:A-kinase anchor protein 7-like phosphoesterase domain-containing protein n=1 Tax=Remersonia thermophila TaxID=72144 RepID=A0ABR4D5Q1_9PEZI